MTSKEILQYLENKEIDKLYKKYENVFALIDKWSERLIQEILLDEYEIAHLIDQSTGCYSKLAPICGALEAIMAENEYNTEISEYSKIEKIKTSDNPIVKAKARASVNDLRRYFSDFNTYATSAEKMILSGQSRLKRLTVEKGAKGVDFTGETPITSTGDKPANPSSTINLSATKPDVFKSPGW